MERHHNAGHKNARVIFWLISLMVLVASPSMVQAAITCGQCHGGGEGSSNVKDSPTGTRNPVDGVFKGNHGTHMPNNPAATQCAVCHGAGAATYTSTHSALNGNRIQMASKIDNYSGLKRARYGKGLFWNMTSVPQLSTAAATCSNVNCHFEKPTDMWGTAAYSTADTATCGKCHDALPTTAAHTTHIVIYGNSLAACNQCHTDYSTAAGKMKFQHATSAGRAIAVKVAYVGSNNKYLPGPASITAPVYGTCSTTYCHSDGTGQYAPISWNRATNPTTGCNFCHPMANLGGAHGKHAGRITLASTTRTYANYTANISDGQEGAGGSYGFGCTTCHPTTTASHLDGAVQVTLAAAANAGTMRSKSPSAVLNGDKSCDNVYCHSDGINAMVVGSNGYAPVWNTTFTGDRCVKCHGNSPTTGAHAAHKVGIHYDNIFSGVSGFLGYSSSGNKAHGVATQATTISCNICHNATVNTAFNKNGSACTSCHSTDAGTVVLDAANGFKFHVNGKVDVSFPATAMRSKAQIRDTSFTVYSGLWTRNGGVNNYKKNETSYDISKQPLSSSVFTAGVAGQGSCANVVCHNQRTGQSVSWNQTLQCVDCHSQL